MEPASGRVWFERVNRYPGRLHHLTPSWVEKGETFHIRISVAQGPVKLLTEPCIAAQLLESAHHYHDYERWHCRLLLLMPDHLHALLIFPCNQPMHAIIGAWKGFQAKRMGLIWQNNFFDHRIRNREGLQESENYIRHNPVRKGLCQNANAWPWLISCA